MHEATARTLLWNEAGHIGCTLAGHAPIPGSDTWNSGRWRSITLNEWINLAAEIGHAPECEQCAARVRRERPPS